MTTPSDRVLHRTSVAATFGLVLMVGATAGYIGWPRVSAAIGVKPAAVKAAPPAYAAGQQIDVPASWYGSSPATLVLFARASCGACQKAEPFLKSLVASLEGRAAVVMAHPSGTDVEDTVFAENMGIAAANVKVVTANLRVKATPTLVLVNQRGAILAAWEGAGKTDRQNEISKTLSQLIK